MNRLSSNQKLPPQPPLPSHHREDPVQQLGLGSNSKVLHTYPSSANAAEQTGIPLWTIHKCLNRKARSAGGFFWRYEGSNDMPDDRGNAKPKRTKAQREAKRRYNRKSVQQLCPSTGRVLNTFPSIRAASEEADIVGSGIGNCLHNRAATAGGFCWRFSEAGGNETESSVPEANTDPKHQRIQGTIPPQQKTPAKAARIERPEQQDNGFGQPLPMLLPPNQSQPSFQDIAQRPGVSAASSELAADSFLKRPHGAPDRTSK